MPMDKHECLLTENVISKLKALKMKYRETELLMSNAENAHIVASRLRQINHDFDFLMSICSFIREGETMHLFEKATRLTKLL